ncbi:MAG: hypothetical protein CMI18_03455 [Opitutaceae bacterium]|nr:hypothetical protein [Opitutaceae bacterium]
MKLSIKTLFITTVVPALFFAGSLIGREVPNFNLFDMHDKDHELYHAKSKAVGLFFTGIGCPHCPQECCYVQKAPQRLRAQEGGILGYEFLGRRIEERFAK